VADDVLGHLYVGEEKVGVWKYGVEPDAGDGRVRVDTTGAGGHLTADVEGLALYDASGDRGSLLVSSRGDSTIAVYTREANNSYLGSFRVISNGEIDAVTGTDRIDVTNFPLGNAFPSGLFVAHDASNSGAAASDFKVVPWESSANALGLVIDTFWDPRAVGALRRR
jgi:3-phytase